MRVSVPTVVPGNAVVLKRVDRWPVVTFLGAAGRACTGARMIVVERRLDPVLDSALPA